MSLWSVVKIFNQNIANFGRISSIEIALVGWVPGHRLVDSDNKGQ